MKKELTEFTRQQFATDAIMSFASACLLKPVMAAAQNFPGALIIRCNIGAVEVTTIVFKDGTLNTTTK